MSVQQSNLKTYSDLGRTCNRCNTYHPESFFSRTSRIKIDGTRGSRAYCKQCEWAERRTKYTDRRETIRKRAKERYKANPKYRLDARRYGLKRHYGITEEQYQALHSQQGGACFICKRDESQILYNRLYVDHCHDSKVVRGLLCNQCNVGLGAFKDSPHLLVEAIKYLNTKK